MFPECLQDFSRMFSGCSDGSYWPGGIRWSFQMKVWTFKIQRNPNRIIRWSPTIWWSQQLLFDDPQVFDDPQLFDDRQLFDDKLEVWTLITEKSTVIPPSLMVLFWFGWPIIQSNIWTHVIPVELLVPSITVLITLVIFYICCRQ